MSATTRNNSPGTYVGLWHFASVRCGAKAWTLLGAKRTYRDGDLMRSWFADHAAMRLEEAPAGAARRDPSIKWEFLILQF